MDMSRLVSGAIVGWAAIISFPASANLQFCNETSTSVGVLVFERTIGQLQQPATDDSWRHTEQALWTSPGQCAIAWPEALSSRRAYYYLARPSFNDLTETEFHVGPPGPAVCVVMRGSQVVSFGQAASGCSIRLVQIRLPRQSGPETFTASHTVTLQPVPKMGPAQPPVSARRTDAPAAPAAPEPGTDRDSLSRYTCYSQPMDRPRLRTKGLTRFASATVVDVRITTPTGPVSQGSLDTLATSISDALEFWTRACRNCSGANLSLIRIGDTLMVKSETLWTLRNFELTVSNTGGPPPPGSPVHVDQVIGRGGVGAGSRTPMETYERVSPNDSGLRRLCSVSRDAVARVLVPMHKAVCQPRGMLADEERAEVRVELVEGPTDCGLSEFVACAARDRWVQLNVGEFDLNASGVSLWPGAADRQRVDLTGVLLHELGHWLGLPHDSGSANGIMTDTFRENICLTDAELATMRNAIDQGWPGLLSEPHGLRYAPSTPGPVRR